MTPSLIPLLAIPPFHHPPFPIPNPSDCTPHHPNPNDPRPPPPRCLLPQQLPLRHGGLRWDGSAQQHRALRCGKRHVELRGPHALPAQRPRCHRVPGQDLRAGWVGAGGPTGVPELLVGGSLRDLRLGLVGASSVWSHGGPDAVGLGSRCKVYVLGSWGSQYHNRGLFWDGGVFVGLTHHSNGGGVPSQ